MDSGGNDTAEKKRQNKFDDKEKHRERSDGETAEERDCRRFSMYRRRDAVHRQQGQLKPKSAYTVNFSCVWTRWRDAVRWQQVAITSVLRLAPKLFYNHLVYSYCVLYCTTVYQVLIMYSSGMTLVWLMAAFSLLTGGQLLLVMRLREGSLLGIWTPCPLTSYKSS